MELQNVPVVKTGMLIRRPVEEVFAAFVDPAITTQFWFTRSSGKLEAGKRVRWDWEMFGVGADVDVKEMEENRRIVIEWPGVGGLTVVEWVFTPRPDNTTFVSITNSGFNGDGDAVVAEALDSMQGFSLVLAGLKAYLEHNVRLNLVADYAPDAIQQGYVGNESS